MLLSFILYLGEWEKCHQIGEYWIQSGPRADREVITLTAANMHAVYSKKSKHYMCKAGFTTWIPIQKMQSVGGGKYH